MTIYRCPAPDCDFEITEEQLESERYNTCNKEPWIKVEPVLPTKTLNPLVGRILNDFTHHIITSDTVVFMAEIQDAARDLALLLERTVPHGRELSTALTRLEECMMHASAGVYRHAR